MNIIAKIMTKSIGKDCRFSEEVIESIVNDRPDVPIRFNFQGDPIGKVNNYYMDESGDLVIEGTIFAKVSDEITSMYVVPGGITTADDIVTVDGINVIKKIKLTELSVTPYPADQTLTTLKEKK